MCIQFQTSAPTLAPVAATHAVYLLNWTEKVLFIFPARLGCVFDPCHVHRDTWRMPTWWPATMSCYSWSTGRCDRSSSWGASDSVCCRREFMWGQCCVTSMRHSSTCLLNAKLTSTVVCLCLCAFLLILLQVMSMILMMLSCFVQGLEMLFSQL